MGLQAVRARALFYHFISENLARYMEGGDPSMNYAKLGEEVITAAQGRQRHCGGN